MPSPSSITTQSQGGSDTSLTTVVASGSSSSTQRTAASQRITRTKQRPDFTITFTLKPNEPPKGIPVL